MPRFYLKLGNCLNPVLDVLNSNKDHALMVNGIVRFNPATAKLEITQHPDAARARLSRLGNANCRKLIIHSHGNGVGKLTVAGTVGGARNVSAAALCEFLSANTTLAQEGRYVTHVYLLACGIGTHHPDFLVCFLDDFASRLALLQKHAVVVYGPYYWVDMRYGSLFLYQGAHVDRVEDLTQENNVDGGSMGSAHLSDANLDNWVAFERNFKCVHYDETGMAK
jgi:hypothetical protein